ncbi:MAG TPA: DUF1573 domain-containing protein [Candidatus Paceibacterota bacterium]
MKNKKIVIVIVIAIVLTMFFWWGKSIQKPISEDYNLTRATESALISSEQLYNFGTISMTNGNVSRNFIMTNSTNKDIVVKSVETSCMCTQAFLVESDGSIKGPFGMAGMGGVTKTEEIIKAGEDRILRVVYNPNAHGPAGVGNIDRFVIVTDSYGNALRFEIKALVTP